MQKAGWDPLRGRLRERAQLTRALRESQLRRQVPRVTLPATEVAEEPDQLIIEVSLPGASQADISVDLLEGGIEIRAVAKPEGRRTDFYRFIALPARAHGIQASSTFGRDRLRVTVPLGRRSRTKPD